MQRNDDIQIHPDDWEPHGDPDPYTRLGAMIGINSTFMHVEAIEVERIDGLQDAKDPELRDWFAQLCAAWEPDGGFQTTEINGRTYCLFVCPFS